MVRKPTSLLNGVNFEQVLNSMWREFEQKNLREAEQKTIPPRKIRGAGRPLAKQPAPKPHVPPAAA